MSGCTKRTDVGELRGFSAAAAADAAAEPPADAEAAASCERLTTTLPNEPSTNLT
jgi:hypothetical protein